MSKAGYTVTETADGKFSVWISIGNSSWSFGGFNSLKEAKLAAKEKIESHLKLEDNKVVKEYYFET
jgi:hypothetical protein